MGGLNNDLQIFVLGLKQEEEKRNEQKEFPPCNVEYKSDPEQTRFWCTTVSIFLDISDRNCNEILFSIPEALNETGPAIPFSSSIKTTSRSRACAPGRSTSIYLNYDRTRIVMKTRARVSRTATIKPTTTTETVLRKKIWVDERRGITCYGPIVTRWFDDLFPFPVRSKYFWYLNESYLKEATKRT